MNKKGFIDLEILTSPAFVILCIFALSATIAGFFLAAKWGTASFPLWQQVMIIVVEIVACYVFAART